MSNYFLFAKPSTISGMARVLDLGCTLNEYNYSTYPEKADYHAINSDWKIVGSDIRTAMARYENQINGHAEEK